MVDTLLPLLAKGRAQAGIVARRTVRLVGGVPYCLCPGTPILPNALTALFKLPDGADRRLYTEICWGFRERLGGSHGGKRNFLSKMGSLHTSGWMPGVIALTSTNECIGSTAP